MTRYEKYKPIYDEFIKLYPFTLDDLPHELWKDIRDYEGLYQVSNFGRVKSFCKGKVKIKTPWLNRYGYLEVRLSKNGKQKTIRVHRLVAEAFILNPDNKPEVDHINNDPLNCCVSNLRWATHSENTRYAVELGAIKSGEGNYLAAFTNDQVVYIRNNPDNLTQGQLAEKFGVHQTTIGDVQLGQTYKNAGGVIRAKRKRAPNLTAEQRAEIRGLYATGNYSQKVLGEMFGICQPSIHKIVRRNDT